MKFYVPEWDDAVDAHYDFVHDELSDLNKQNRDRDFIWDIFDYESVPIDGVLISREQVEDSATKNDRMREHGIYSDPQLNVPEWLPTISDCGAWGYKSLPFPRYGNEGMLQFYEDLCVSVGVTIDHLVLGSGKERGRIYLDERALSSGFAKDDLPTELVEKVDVMIDEWPTEWPDLVQRYDESIYDVSAVEPFTQDAFDGDVQEILARLDTDPRAVYREDDKQIRYKMTLENAAEMRDLYENGNWSFRLMAAFQGWNPTTYKDALDEVLQMGYQYVGVGGVAGSQLEQVEEIVTEVGHRIADFELENNTRIDTHVFGFAKTDGFETIGRSQMTSIDSASMLRAAWTGGSNYHLNSNERFDAIRVRYPAPGAPLENALRKSMLGQEVLRALRAFGEGESISTRLRSWETETEQVLDSLVEYLNNHRHDEIYDARLIREITAEFRERFEYGYELQASFSDDMRKTLVKLLRADDPDDPTDFDEYLAPISVAREAVSEFPRTADRVDTLERESGEVASFKQIWTVVENYASSDLVGDEDHLDGYRETIRSRSWERCDCPICEKLGIETAVFRGNNRNRRRGFHNMYRFYQKFTDELPKILVVVQPDSTILDQDTVESYLTEAHEGLWEVVHDIPVAEIGVIDGNGVYEWWEPAPTSISPFPASISDELETEAGRYDTVIYYDADPDRQIDIDFATVSSKPREIRELILEELGYGPDFSPSRDVQIQLEEF